MDWVCEAYGGDAAGDEADGASGTGACFFEAGDRCGSLDSCRDRMGWERRRIFRIIQEQAAAGDPVFERLAQVLASPADILNGEQGPSDADAQ